MGDQKFRVGGGYTAFVYNGKPVLYLDQIADTAPRPVAAPEPVQPLDEAYPIEIAFPKAAGAGTLVLSIREQWASNVWETLPGYEGTNDIVEVFQRNIDSGGVTCMKIITGPNGVRRGFSYNGCVITDINDSETITIGTMTLPKQITLMYLKKVKL